jgi:hypothetical protein
VGNVPRGRKPQSLHGFLCAPAPHVPDMSGTFMETENYAISISCVVELRGFELMAITAWSPFKTRRRHVADLARQAISRRESQGCSRAERKR